MESNLNVQHRQYSKSLSPFLKIQSVGENINQAIKHHIQLQKFEFPVRYISQTFASFEIPRRVDLMVFQSAKMSENF